MKLSNYESRMVHDGKRNNREVLIHCEVCGSPAWVRWQRVKKGQGRFCSRECSNGFQRLEGKKSHGKENTKFYWDQSRECWYAHWIDEKTGKQTSTTRAKWLWEDEYGDVPDGFVVTYKNRNPHNCELDNLELVTRGDRTSEALMGHYVSDEAKRKMSEAHTGKVLSEEHKAKIGAWTKSKWEDGTFGSDEYLEKLRGREPTNKGVPHTEETKSKMSLAHKRLFEDPEYKEYRKRFVVRGEDHPNWKGGTSYEPYSPEFTAELKAQVQERDEHACRVCLEFNPDWVVHHINGDKKNSDIDNLVLLCRSCHGRIHMLSESINDAMLYYQLELVEAGYYEMES